MRGITHAVLGGATGLGVAALAGVTRENWLPAYLVGIGIGLLPNIDHLAPALARREGPVARFAQALGDPAGEGRKLTHSLWALLVVGLAVLLGRLVGWVEAWAAWAALGAYLFHLLGDMWAYTGGVQLLAPFGEAVVVPPASNLRLRRGGLGESWILVAAAFIGIWVLSPWVVSLVMHYLAVSRPPIDVGGLVKIIRLG